MRAHHRHRSRLHLDDAVPVRPVSPLVYANPRLWPAAPMLDAKPPGPIAGRVPPAHLFRPVQPDTVAPSAGTRTDQLSRSVAGTVRLPEGAPAALLAD